MKISSRLYALHCLLSMLICVAPLSARAQAQEIVLLLKNHQFSPKELSVPANKKIKLVVRNQDPTPAEFESTDLNREKAVAANSEISVFIGPLDPGRYEYLDDFHRDLATGTIVAK